MLYPDRKKRYSLIVRAVAAVLLPCVTIMLAPLDLMAQTYESYDRRKDKVGTYVDRASRLEDREAWENYVDLGIAQERAEWERGAYEVLMKRVGEINKSDEDQETKEARIEDERALLEAASATWNAEAAAERDANLGRFIAEKEAVEVAEREADEYEAIIAATEAAMASRPDATLEDWDAALTTDHAALVADFEAELAAGLGAARANNATLTGDALSAFEDRLADIEADIRAEFETRDRFYITRARNRYVAVLRGDDLNARLASEEGSADAVVQQIIASTEESLATETTDQLQAAIDEADGLVNGPAAADFEAAGTNWEARMEAVIESGLRAWQTAEEDLYAKRLAWQEQTNADREEGNRIWQEQYDQLVGARNEWLDEVQVQIQEGRDQWQAKIAEFQESRQQSEQELAEYIQSERERWDAASQELADIVNGGGSALLETKDAFNYYNELIDAIGPPGVQDPRDADIYNFYVNQRNYMQGAVGRFQSILAGAEGVLNAQMHSDEASSGLLNDVRLFAGDLPDAVEAIDVDDFETDLMTEMRNRGEDFLLYRRDIEGIVEQNAIFVTRAEELESSADFDYNSATSLEGLGELIEAVDRKYADHRVELGEIFAKDRSDLTDDAARLAAVKSDIAAWMTLSTERNERLKKKTVEYFNIGLGGYYLTGNEGDPYMMTRAEYEWEILRRERNYLTKKLRRAEEVKRYADLAFQHEAGLEMAAVTAERTEIAKVQRDLTELSYLLVKGDPTLNLDEAVYTDPVVRDSELTRLLAERGVDLAALDAREATLNQERAALDDLLAYAVGSPPDAAQIASLIGNIDSYLETAFPDSMTDFDQARADHPLGITRARLTAFRDQLASGADAAVVNDRWTTLRGGASALRGELQLLADDYDFDRMRADIETLRDRMDDENLTVIRGDLDEIKQQIEANATLLAAAKEELDLAKDAYRQARIDFDVIRAGNSQDLIRIDLQNTTGLLASVTHRMAKIEDIDGFNGVYGAADEQRIRYLNEINQRERANADLTDSAAAFATVQGLEEAKRRGRELENLLTGAGDLAAQSPADLADLFIGAKANILTSDAAEAHLNSTASARDAFALIEFARGELDRLQTEVDTAVAGGEADEIALARSRLSQMQDAIYRGAETLVAAVRGEEEARLQALYYFLESTDGGGDPLADPTSIQEEVIDGDEILREEAFELSKKAAERLSDFLNASAPDGGGYRDFAGLLEIVNTTIAGLSRGVNLDDGYGQQTGLADSERAEWNIVRNWLMSHQEQIEYAGKAPDEFDATPVEDKWRALLEGAAGIADDAGAYNDFAAGVPDDASDPWVVAFVNGRESLATNIEGALALNDAGMTAAYAGMSANDRALIYNFIGPLDPSDTEQLRAALTGVARAARLEVAGAPENYKRYYHGEQSRILGERLQELETDLAEQGGRLAALKVERDEHVQYKTYLEGLSDPAKAAQIAELAAAIADLETTIAAREPAVKTLETEYRQTTALAREAAGQGASVPLLNEAMQELYLSQTGRAMQAEALALMSAEQYIRDEQDNDTAVDQVKAIIGFFETDATGEIRRDGSGTPIVSQEFIDAGISDPSADLASLLAGEQRGDDLLKWAERLNEASGDEVKSANLSPEVLAAIDGLETAIRSYLTATELIDRRYESTDAIKNEAQATKTDTEGVLNKMLLVTGLENDLRAAIDDAVNNDRDPVTAALVVLETPEAARILQLFKGFDENGEPDGIVAPDIAAKTDELIQMAARLRQARLDRRVLEIATQYAGIQGEYAEYVSLDRGVLAPDRESLLDSLSEFDVTVTRDAINVVAVDPDPANAATTRADIWTWIESAPEDARYFRGTVIEILTASPNEGQVLKDEIVAALNAQSVDIQDRLGVHFTESERQAARDGELVVTRSVSQLLDVYAERATIATDTLQPVIDAIPELTDLSTARGDFRAALDRLTDPEATDDPLAIAGFSATELADNRSALHSIRADLIVIAHEAPDTLTLKINLANYLAGLANPDAAELDQLENELYVTTLNDALGILSLNDPFDADLYPEELHELILVRENQQAEEAYAEFNRQRASTNPNESAGASLNLSGLHPPIAKSILTRDFVQWQSSATGVTDLIDARRAGGEGVGLTDYLAAYLQDRNTGMDRLPGGEILAERVMQVEYARLQNDISANGIAAVDENDYFDDLREYILMQKAAHFFAANGTTLTGATVADRIDNFESDFDALLNDPAQVVGGKTIQARHPGKDERDRFHAMAFAYLEEGPPLESFLPGSLGAAYLENRLGDPPPSASDYLPDELKAVTDYATADYRAMARAIHPETEAALARIEVQREAGVQDWTVAKTDAELSDIIARAGHPSLPATARDEIMGMLRAHGLRERTGGQATPETAAIVLRQNRALAHFYPNDIERQAADEFLATEGERVSSIEKKFFEALGERHSDLREAAREDRGAFLRALVEREGGNNTPYYDALGPELKAELALMRADFFGSGSDALSAEESTALRTKAAEYERTFDLRSNQELISSGIFENAEQTIVTAVVRSGSENARALLDDHANRALLQRALIETVQRNAGQRSALSSEAQALLSFQPELADIVTRAADEMEPAQRNLLEREQVLIDRFFAHFAETAEERRELGRILHDPATLNPDAALSLEYDIAREQILLERQQAELTAALTATVSDHQRFFSEARKDRERESARANELLKFALFRGDDYQTSRFSNYRTYIGAERQYQADNFDQIERNGGTLESASMGVTDVEGLLNGDFQATLTSDGTGTFKTVYNDLGEEIQIRAVKTVSDATTRFRGNDAAAQAAEMRATYFENLANNYLEATSQLNSALNAIWIGAKMTDNREAAARADIKQTVRDNYDPTAASAADISAIQDLKIDAQSRLSIHNQNEIQGFAAGITGALEQLNEQADTFAGAGRRKQIAGMNLGAYVENRFNAVAGQMSAAEANHTSLSNIADGLRNQFAGRNRDLADGLERMAEYWREYEFANDEYEERAHVQEYAETPYLYASAADSNDQENSELLEEYRGDAKEEYEKALAAVDNAQQRLQQKGYEIQTQDNLEEFNAIVTGLQSGTTYPPLNTTDAERLLELRDRKFNEYETLSTAEEGELTALARREMYARYGDVIDTQQEHIKQTMRMTRMHKASEIVNAEIMRLRAVADEKQKQFEDELNGTFGAMGGGHATYATSVGSDATRQMAARDGVYLRMSMLVETGGSFWNEFRGWYMKSTDWIGNAADSFISSTASTQGGIVPEYTMNQILEGVQGYYHASQINAIDRSMLGGWLKAGGMIPEYGAFQGVYYSALQAIGVRDQKYIKNEIIKSIYEPIRHNGVQMQRHWHPIPKSIGRGMETYANAELVPARIEYEVAEIIRWMLYRKAHQTASKSSTMQVMARQKEYEDALAKLYYFTRIPDLATFKSRLIQYGAQNGDDPNDNSGAALYQILEDGTEINGEVVDDLIYMRDEASGYVKSNGSAYTPDADTVNDTLDVTNQLQEADYRDGFGRRYDPATITASQPGPMQGGFYRGGDGNYVRIEIANPNGSVEYRYAKLKDEGAAKEKVYNMGEVLETLVDHGTQIRNREHEKYINAHETAAGAINDRSFLLNEKDQTYEMLFNQAAGHHMGGREFTGYRLTYEDYNGNSKEVYEAELTQRQQTQQHEWALRQQELMDRYQSWEARVGTILERGRKSWAGSEDRFLARWRDWQRDFDRKEEEGREKWDAKIKEHFEAKEQWESDTRKNASEATIEKVLADQVTIMNNQLRRSAQSLGVDIETIDMTAAINAAKAEMENSMPSGVEKLKSINKNIKDFSTRLSIAEMTGGDFLNDALSIGGEFRSAMKEHQHRMKILTNVKIFEQYRTMARKFEESIDDRNAQVDQQTELAAIQAGFYRSGSIYLKVGENDAKGVVHAYKYFDVRGALQREKEKAGFSEMTGNDLVDFLENRNEVEVEAYFYTQKLALQAAIEAIQGKPNAPKGSTDVNEIGQFNAWVGDNGNGTLRQAATRASGNSFSSNPNEKAQAIEIMTAGFGELGARGRRPGGAPLGFYPELEHMSRFVAEQEANAPSKKDPITTTLQQFNPIEMYKKVEIGSRVHGYDRGKLIEAQGAQMVKTATKVVGNALVAVGTGIAVAASWTGAGLAIGAATAAVGAGLVIASNSMNVNTETGETSMKLTERNFTQSIIEIGGSALSGLATATGQAWAVPLINGATSAMSGMMDGNDDGSSVKLTNDGRKMEAALAGGALSAAAGYIPGAGNVAADTFIGALKGNTQEWMMRQTFGQKYSNYDYIAENPDFASTMGSLLGGYAVAGIKEAGKSRKMKMAKEAQKNGNKDAALKILMGMGYRREDAMKELGIKSTKVKIAGGSGGGSGGGMGRGSMSNPGQTQSGFVDASGPGPVQEAANSAQGQRGWYEWIGDGLRSKAEGESSSPRSDSSKGPGFWGTISSGIGRGLSWAGNGIKNAAIGAWNGLTDWINDQDDRDAAAEMKAKGNMRVAEFLFEFNKFRKIVGEHTEPGVERDLNSEIQSYTSHMDETQTGEHYLNSSKNGWRTLWGLLPSESLTASADKNGLMRVTKHKTSGLWGMFGTTQERYEFTETGEVKNTIYRDGGLFKYIAGMDDTYINGVQMNDGDGVYRAPDDSMRVVKQKDLSKFVWRQKLGKKDRMIFTINGVRTDGLEAIDMNNEIRNTMHDRTQKLGENYKGSMHIYNRSRGEFLGDVGNLFASYISQMFGGRGTEKSYDSVRKLVTAGAFNRGGLMVAHSQGAQIAAHAISQSKTLTKMTFVTLGGAHMNKPDNVAHHYDLRNKFDRITGLLHRTGDLIDSGEAGKYTRIYGQETVVDPDKPKVYRASTRNRRGGWRPQYKENIRWEANDVIRHSVYNYARGLDYLMNEKGVDLLK